MDDLQKFIASKVKAELSKIFDPEIPVNIVDLGLIYDIEINKEMDWPSINDLDSPPPCPAPEIIPSEVHAAAATVDGIQKVNVDITFNPLDRILYQKRQGLH